MLKGSLGIFALSLGTLHIFPLGFGWAASSLGLEPWYLVGALSCIVIRSPEKSTQKLLVEAAVLIWVVAEAILSPLPAEPSPC